MMMNNYVVLYNLCKITNKQAENQIFSSFLELSTFDEVRDALFFRIMIVFQDKKHTFAPDFSQRICLA